MRREGPLGLFHGVIKDIPPKRVLDLRGLGRDPPAEIGVPVAERVLKDLTQTEGAVDPLPRGASMPGRPLVGLCLEMVVACVYQGIFNLSRKAGADRDNRRLLMNDRGCILWARVALPRRGVAVRARPDLPAGKIRRWIDVTFSHGSYLSETSISCQ